MGKSLLGLVLEFAAGWEVGSTQSGVDEILEMIMECAKLGNAIMITAVERSN